MGCIKENPPSPTKPAGSGDPDIQPDTLVQMGENHVFLRHCERHTGMAGISVAIPLIAENLVLQIPPQHLS